MKKIRRTQDRGHAQHGWLESRHTFSFAGYRDPAFMGFGDLRVINEDLVKPAKGFGTHPHQDMEILSYVLDGGLEHKDSMGNGSIIRPGDVQLMSAGTGVRHSEFNASSTDPVHFLQIWVIPDSRGGAPGYQQQHYPVAERTDHLRLVASKSGADGALHVKQDVNIYATVLGSGTAGLVHTPPAGRRTWIQVARGEVQIGDDHLSAGDGFATDESTRLAMSSPRGAELLLFDLRDA